MKYRLKIVTDVSPNADGRWIEVEKPTDTFAEAAAHSSWLAAAERFKDDIPAGEHMVSYERVQS